MSTFWTFAIVGVSLGVYTVLAGVTYTLMENVVEDDSEHIAALFWPVTAVVVCFWVVFQAGRRLGRRRSRQDVPTARVVRK